MNERIRELRTTLKMTLEKFGERLGVGKTAISKLEKGERNVTDQMFKSICREFHVNEEWLRTGTGDMFLVIPENEEVSRCTQELLETQGSIVTDALKNFIVIYQKLDDTSKSILENVLSELLDSMTKKDQP